MGSVLARRKGNINNARGYREVEGKFKENGIWLESRRRRLEGQWKQTRKEVWAYGLESWGLLWRELGVLEQLGDKTGD